MIPSVLNYVSVAFYGSITQYLKFEMDKSRKMCARLTSGKLKNEIKCNDNIYEGKVMSYANKILKDTKHPLHAEYTLLPSRERYNIQYTRTKRYRQSFIPVSVRMLNDNYKKA